LKVIEQFVNLIKIVNEVSDGLKFVTYDVFTADNPRSDVLGSVEYPELFVMPAKASTSATDLMRYESG
jgi:hypothetical protein